MMSRRFQVAAVPEAVAQARQAVVEALHERASDAETLETVRLLVSELVTNSIIHGRSDRPIGIELRSEGDRLRVEVTNCGRGFAPRPGAMASAWTGGFGLFMVEQLADRWGVARDGDTHVWFELAHDA